MSETQTRELEHLPLSVLTRPDEARDLRNGVVEDIKDRIEESEYNPARPLRVFDKGDKYAVADGNHRLAALRDLKPESHSVPCVVEPDSADLVTVMVESNRDEDTYAEQDLFDYLDYIADLRDDHTQAEIAERLGWSRSKVNNYTSVLGEVDTAVLELARSHEQGRVSSDDTPVSITNFTEYWFRTSGLYDLNRDGVDSWDGTHAQMRVMEWFVEEKSCDASKNQLQQKASEVLDVCKQLGRLDDELNAGVDDATREQLREQVIEHQYTADTLETAIGNANDDAQDRVVFGVDALGELREMEANSVDLVVTDPPYGEDFASVRDSGNPEFADSAAETFDLLDAVFAELDRVTAANAHVYVFFSMTHYDRLVKTASEHFDVNETPIIWAKHNHAPTAPGSNGFEKSYAQKYEPILFCRGENGQSRPLRPNEGGVCPNLLTHKRPSGEDRWHDTQKPLSLLRELITNSSAVGETVLDPFAGSGSTLLAAAKEDRHYVGFELDGEYESSFTRALREVNNE